MQKKKPQQFTVKLNEGRFENQDLNVQEGELPATHLTAGTRILHESLTHPYYLVCPQLSK